LISKYHYRTPGGPFISLLVRFTGYEAKEDDDFSKPQCSVRICRSALVLKDLVIKRRTPSSSLHFDRFSLIKKFEHELLLKCASLYPSTTLSTRSRTTAAEKLHRLQSCRHVTGKSRKVVLHFLTQLSPPLISKYHYRTPGPHYLADRSVYWIWRPGGRRFFKTGIFLSH